MKQVYKQGRKFVVGAIGGLVLLAGILMIPYPGPGWLVVIAGMGILSTEFIWAENLRKFTVRHYERWLGWFRAQNFTVKVMFAFATFCVVVASIWLVNGYGIIANWLDLPYEWLKSPFLRL
ncbi:MAG: TIGR02611 family protein [bacterium]|nr:TIGR02611 family protein [bacterium]MDN5835632.1 TIGR02611 family protein [bacterium]